MNRIFRTNLPRWVLPTGLVLAGAVAAVSFLPMSPLKAAQVNKATPAATPAAKASGHVLAVLAASPEQRTWPQTIAASGPITPWQEASIAAELSGVRIVRLAAEVGQTVRRGDLLAQLADDGIRAELAQREAELAKARALMGEAKANGQRARSMQAQGAWSEQMVMQYLTTEQSAIATVAQAQAMVATQRIRLSQTRIVAPDDGFIASRNATLGAVTGGGAELFRLVRQARLEWRAELNSAHIAQITPGQSARIHLADGRTVSGSVRMLAPTLDSATRNATLHIDLAAASPARAGMYAQGEIEVGNKAALTVPQAALIMRDGRAMLFALEGKPGSASIPNQASTWQVHARKVETGRRRDGRVEIIAGLAADTRIVSDGAAFLNDGDSVQVKQATSEGAF